MKKIKILLLNLILFVILFHIADFYASQKAWHCDWIYKSCKNKIISYLKFYKKLHHYSFIYNKKWAAKQFLSNIYQENNKDNNISKSFRPVENKNADKSLIIFGCSYAYGLDFDKDETFSYRLSKLLPTYKIYNRAQSGWTTSHMLYQLENNDFSDITNVKYVIYTFIIDHIIRNDYYTFDIRQPYYKLKSDSLYLKKYSLNYIDVPLVKYIQQYKKYRFYKNMQKYKNKIELTKRIIEKSKFKSEMIFGKDTKFIIFRYDRGEEEVCNAMLEELKKEGFIVVSLKDLSDTNYITPKYQLSKTDSHPNALAWKEITPLFVKYLQTRGYLKD